MIDPFEFDDIFWTRSRIMEMPDGYRTIEKTGTARSPSLPRRPSLSPYVRRCTKVARTSFWVHPVRKY